MLTFLLEEYVSNFRQVTWIDVMGYLFIEQGEELIARRDVGRSMNWG